MANFAGGEAESDEVHAKSKEEYDQDPNTDLCCGTRGRLEKQDAGDEHPGGYGHAEQYERRTQDPRDRAAGIVAHVRSRRVRKADVFKRVQMLAKPLQIVTAPDSFALSRNVAIYA